MHVHTALLFTAVATLAAVEAKVELSTMSLNVRTSNAGEWNGRHDSMLQLIKDESPDFIGTQETAPEQFEALMSNTDYDTIGECASSDCNKDERTNIMYKKASWELIDNGDIALSGSPEYPEALGSNSWRLAFNRLVTWGRFKSTQDPSATVCYFNTHYDMSLGQVKSSKLIRQQMAQICQDGDLAMLTGDLNTVPGSMPISLLTADDSPFPLTNALEAVGNTEGTFIGNGVFYGSASTIFDYVFARAKDLCITDGQVVSNVVDGMHDSDHLHPVGYFCIGADCTCKNNGGGQGYSDSTDFEEDATTDDSTSSASAQSDTDFPTDDNASEPSPEDSTQEITEAPASSEVEDSSNTENSAAYDDKDPAADTLPGASDVTPPTEPIGSLGDDSEETPMPGSKCTAKRRLRKQ